MCSDGLWCTHIVNVLLFYGKLVQNVKRSLQDFGNLRASVVHHRLMVMISISTKWFLFCFFLDA